MAQRVAARPIAFVLALVASVASAAAQPVDGSADERSAGTHYFVEFRARSSAYIGHTFIVYGRADARGRVVESQIAGMIPDVAGWRGIVFPISGRVRHYKDDTLLPTLISYRRRLTPAQYARVTRAVRYLRANEHRWHAIFFNCNDFAIEIAETLGLWRPPSLMVPRDWVATLRAMNGD